MAFIFRNSLLRPRRHVNIALQYLPGVGWRKAMVLSTKLGLHRDMFLKNINKYYWRLMHTLLKKTTVSYVRKSRRVASNIARLIEINTYRGIRHKYCLPVRGQRSRTNANTQRSKRIVEEELLND